MSGLLVRVGGSVGFNAAGDWALTVVRSFVASGSLPVIGI